MPLFGHHATDDDCLGECTRTEVILNFGIGTADPNVTRIQAPGQPFTPQPTSRPEMVTDVNSATSAANPSAGQQTRLAPIKTRNVYVSGLPIGFSDTHLAAMLSQFGKVTSCRMFNETQRVESLGRSYGFALFERFEDANTAVRLMDGEVIEGFKLRVQLSETQVVKKTKASRHAARAASGVEVGSMRTRSGINSAPSPPAAHRTTSVLTPSSDYGVSTPFMPVIGSSTTSTAPSTPLPSIGEDR
jgi:RNA recognition motif-containing protein